MTRKPPYIRLKKSTVWQVWGCCSESPIKLPHTESTFTDESQVKTAYYSDIERLLRANRREERGRTRPYNQATNRRIQPRPAQLIHVDKTPSAAEAGGFRHLLLKRQSTFQRVDIQFMNMWRPIQNAASYYPLAVVDWRSTRPSDFVAIDLLYHKGFQGEGR